MVQSVRSLAEGSDPEQVRQGLVAGGVPDRVAARMVARAQEIRNDALRQANGERAGALEDTRATTFVADLPERLIGDRAHDSDRLDGVLRDGGMEMIAPHRRGRRKTQDGRKLRRYRRRWRVERLFAWLFCWRRLVVRYEHYPESFLRLVQLACVLIPVRCCT